MDEEENKCNEYKYLKSFQIENVGDSLIYYYLACLTRATAILWGSDIKQAIEESIAVFSNIKKYKKYKVLYTLKNINQTRKSYCNSRMINKSLLPVNIEDCMSAFKPNDGYSCAAEPPVQYRLSHLSRRSEPLIKHTICMMRVYSRNALSNPYTSRMEISCSASMLVMLMR